MHVIGASKTWLLVPLKAGKLGSASNSDQRKILRNPKLNDSRLDRRWEEEPRSSSVNKLVGRSQREAARIPDCMLKLRINFQVAISALV